MTYLKLGPFFYRRGRDLGEGGIGEFRGAGVVTKNHSTGLVLWTGSFVLQFRYFGLLLGRPRHLVVSLGEGQGWVWHPNHIAASVVSAYWESL